MPDMDGIEATIAILEKEKSTGLHQPVVAMTALARKVIVNVAWRLVWTVISPNQSICSNLTIS